LLDKKTASENTEAARGKLVVDEFPPPSAKAPSPLAVVLQ
jgi:hypothetical protein